MEKEHYNKLVEKVGQKKVNGIKFNIEINENEKMMRKDEQIKREKKFIEIAIKKEELEDQVYYIGFRFRGDGMAMWNEKIGKFLIITYEFDKPCVEKLEHFADVIDKGFDGFVPIEKVDKNKYWDIRKVIDNDKIEEEIEKRKK